MIRTWKTRTIRVAFISLLAAWVATASACQSPAAVNVAREAGLGGTTKIEILQSPAQSPTDFVLQTTVVDPGAIREVVSQLDQRVPLQPPAACLPQYRLRFQLANASVQEFDYFCQGGTSFLRGSQSFWQQKEVRPPADFDRLVQRLITPSG